MTLAKDLKVLLCSLSTAILILEASSTSLAANKPIVKEKPPVHILSWWGYLEKDDPQLAAISDRCGANLAVDEFYSNMEFERRYTSEPNKYDIIIYQETNRGILGSRIESNDFPIATSNDYAPTIKRQFDQRKYLANTKLFQISLTGLLWEENPSVNVTKKSTIGEVFKQFRNQTIAILDDYAEAAHFFKILLIDQKTEKGIKEISFPNKNDVKAILGDNHVVFANDIDQLVKDPKFGLAYTWSGSAMFIRTNNPTKKFQFLVHPDLSYASADLISLLKKNSPAKCVADALASRSFLGVLSTNTKYFSPYGQVASVNEKLSDSNFSALQEEFFTPNANFSWLGDLSLNNHRTLQTSWLELKTFLAVSRP